MTQSKQHGAASILIAGFFIQILTSIPASWGVFQKSVSQEYGFSQEDTSMIFSVMICFFGIGCILGGLMQDKAGPKVASIVGSVLLFAGFLAASFLPVKNPWWFYACFSVPVGLGCSFLYPAVMSCAQKWYANQKGLATGVIGCAVGLSGAVLTFLGRTLTNQFGIRNTFWQLALIIGGVCLIASCFLKNPPTKAQQQTSKQKEYTIKEMLKTSQYWILFFVVCFATPAVLLFSPRIVEMGQERGLSEQLALSCIWIGSIACALGRLSMPWLSDKIGRRNVDLFLFAGLTVFSVWFAFAQSGWMLLVYCLLTFCYAGEAAVIPSLVTDLFGQKNSGIHYGFVALGMSFGSLFFPILARIFDLKQSRHWIAIFISALGFILLFFLKPMKQNDKAEKTS